MTKQIIYATPFKASTLKCTGPSLDSGFESLDHVVELMGSVYEVLTPRLIIYGPDEDRIVYSDFAFSIDGEVNSD